MFLPPAGKCCQTQPLLAHRHCSADIDGNSHFLWEAFAMETNLELGSECLSEMQSSGATASNGCQPFVEELSKLRSAGRGKGTLAWLMLRGEAEQGRGTDPYCWDIWIFKSPPATAS